MTNSKLWAISMVIVSLAVIAAFLYGIATRPVVIYSVSTSLGYNQTIDLAANDLKVDLRARNSGSSAAKVWLIVRFYNMSLKEPSLSIRRIENASEIRIPIEVPASTSQTFGATFNSPANASYLVLVLSVEGNSEAELATKFHTSLALFSPERPNALILKHVEGQTFMRVSSR